MNLEVRYAYLNKKQRTDNRLNLSLVEIVKNKKGDKSYINYGITLWDDDADKYEKKLVVGDKTKQTKSSCVFFKGYVTNVNTYIPEDNAKIYNTFYVNLDKANGSFGIVGEEVETEKEEDLFGE